MKRKTAFVILRFAVRKSFECAYSDVSNIFCHMIQDENHKEQETNL